MCLVNFLKLIGEVDMRTVISALKSLFSIHSTSSFCNSELRIRIRYRMRTATSISVLYPGSNSPRNNVPSNTYSTDWHGEAGCVFRRRWQLSRVRKERR